MAAVAIEFLSQSLRRNDTVTVAMTVVLSPLLQEEVEAVPDEKVEQEEEEVIFFSSQSKEVFGVEPWREEVSSQVSANSAKRIRKTRGGEISVRKNKLRTPCSRLSMCTQRRGCSPYVFEKMPDISGAADSPSPTSIVPLSRQAQP